MSSGVFSGLSVGVGETQLSLENDAYSSKLAELQAEIFTGDFTDSQRKTLTSLANTVTFHLTEMDYSGTKRDLEGNPVPNEHLQRIDELFEPYGGIEKW